MADSVHPGRYRVVIQKPIGRIPTGMVTAPMGTMEGGMTPSMAAGQTPMSVPMAEEGGYPPPDTLPPVPSVYGYERKTPLQINVEVGENTFDFDLQSE